MKKFLLFSIFVLVASSAYAAAIGDPYNQTITNNINVNNASNTSVNNIDESAKNEYGVELDAPNLVILTDDWSVGAELRKDMYHTDIREGNALYVKATFKGNLFDFRGNKVEKE